MHVAVTKQDEKHRYSFIIHFSSTFCVVHVEGGELYVLCSPDQRTFMKSSEFRIKLHSFCKEIVISHVCDSLSFSISNVEEMVSIHGGLVLFLSLSPHIHHLRNIPTISAL